MIAYLIRLSRRRLLDPHSFLPQNSKKMPWNIETQSVDLLTPKAFKHLLNSLPEKKYHQLKQ